MTISNQQIERLAHIAALATESGQNQTAMTIFDGLKAIRPTNPATLLGWAIAKIGVHEYQDAIDTLRCAILPIDPNNQLAQCFLGQALIGNGQHDEGEKLLAPHLDAADPVCRCIARSASLQLNQQRL